MSKMRGGCICSDELADTYDRNRQADIDTIRAAFPMASEIRAVDGSVIFEITIDSVRWVFQAMRPYGDGWFSRKEG